MAVKNRAWVKNAAIIFLSVLLVLSFFSNTIMNYSLPEVSGQYAYGGTIASAIRGQGTVTANMSYNISLGETRQIQSVLVKAGERVAAGQVLFMLEATDSDELRNAIRTLDELNLALTKKLLQMRPADYGAEDRAISLLQEEITELEARRSVANEHAAELIAAKAAVKAADSALDARLAEQAAIEETIALLNSTDELDYEKLLSDSLKKLSEELEAAQEAQKAAQKALDQAEAALAAGSGDQSGALSTLLTQIASVREQITSLKSAKEQKKMAVLALIESRYGTATAPQQYADYTAAKNGLPDTQDEYDAAIVALLNPSVHSSSETDIQSGIAEYLNYDVEIRNKEITLGDLESQFYSAQGSSNVSAQLKNNVTDAKNKLEKAKEKTEEAQKAFDRAFKEFIYSYKEQLNAKKAEVKAAQTFYDERKAAQTEIEQKSVLTPEEIGASIKVKQREIESMLFALAEQKKDDGISQALEELDLQSDRKAIDEQEELIEKLRDKAEPSEVTARYGGVITAVNCIAGDKVDAGRDLASLDIEGKGFSTSFTVTNEQAQKVKIGDSATINYRWGDPVLVTLSAIRNDPQGQGRTKILEFTIDGPVSVGENLNLTIGQRDQSYEVVLPNSAIREDADGTFILIAETKSTPLGNRYTAVRVDVTVLAKDDINTAIARDTYNNEFVITTATKPVEPGTQVRLINK